MQKWIIPILVSLMSLALSGILVIQYRWIDRAVSEKNELIDNNVIQAVEEVEEQLTDHRAMSFITEDSLDLNHPEKLLSLDAILNDVDASELTYESGDDSAIKMEIKVMSSDDIKSMTDSINGEQHVIHHQVERHYQREMDSLDFSKIEEGLDQIHAVLNKINIEFHADNDTRLDSAKVEKLLRSELKAKGLGEMSNWAIWDNRKGAYITEPLHRNRMEYTIPLFTSDVINPGRYDLHLSLHKSDLIWKEIWPMVILSLIFLLIICAVFVMSIKLILKHKKISQIKSDFINNMTHEFKTPLASISLAADSLTHPNTTLTKENVEKYVRIIQAEKNKLNFQVERILEVAALNKNALDIPLETVDANHVIQKAIRNFELQLEQGKLHIQYEPVTGVQIQANAFHLENVLINLIDNGVKYSKGKAEISINLDDKTGIISVSDKGIGMDSKQLSRVFDNFYRAQSGNLHDTKGFGLGLSYCKLVIEKMGGHISLKSQPGKGTTAIIELKQA